MPPSDASVLDAQGREVHKRIADEAPFGKSRATLEEPEKPKFFGDDDGPGGRTDEKSQLLISRKAATANKRRRTSSLRTLPGFPGSKKPHSERTPDAQKSSSVRSFQTSKSKDGLQSYVIVSGVIGQGDHFGEFCLQSGSGVRQETATTLTACDLYTISRTNLEDQVVSYESDDVLAMFNDLLQVHKLTSASAA